MAGEKQELACGSGTSRGENRGLASGPGLGVKQGLAKGFAGITRGGS